MSYQSSNLFWDNYFNTDLVKLAEDCFYQHRLVQQRWSAVLSARSNSDQSIRSLVDQFYPKPWSHPLHLSRHRLNVLNNSCSANDIVLSLAVRSMQSAESSSAIRNSFRRRFDTITCTVMVMSSAIWDIGVRSWLNKVKETKAISGVSTFLESIRMNVENVERATYTVYESVEENKKDSYQEWWCWI